MHKLDRSAVPAPECLQNPPDGWCYRDLRAKDRQQIRAALLVIQGDRCAYCERRTGNDPKHDGHIEHLRDQCGHKQLDLDWDNLFWSCNDQLTCGKLKDQCRKHSGPLAGYDPNVLIDPAREDPEKYLLFVSDGTVQVRDDLDEMDRRRAETTVRVFGLAESAYLRRSRRDAVRPYLQFVEFLEPNHLVAFAKVELQNAPTAQFGTAIKHFLESVIP